MKTIFYDIVESIASDLSMGYYKGDEAYNNFIADDATFPAIFVDMPVRTYIIVRQSGQIDVRVVADILFSNKTTDMDDTSDQQVIITDAMFSKVLQFLDRLQNESIVWEILEGSYTDDFLNIFDMNISGVMLHLEFLVHNPRSVCID